MKVHVIGFGPAEILHGKFCFLSYMEENALSQSDCGILKSAISQLRIV